MNSVKKALEKKYKGMYFGAKPPKLLRVHTGYVGLDYILGGGLPLGRITQLAAPPSVGKSTTALCIARTLLQKGMMVGYVDLERTCDEDRIEFLGIKGEELDSESENPNDVVNLFHYCRPSDGEQALEFATDIAAMGAKLVVIDSVPNLIPKTVMDSEVGKQNYSPVAKFLGNESSKLIASFEQSQSCLLLINQVRDNVGSMFGGKSNPGGYAIKHALSINIDMFRTGASKANESTYLVNYKTVKNKTYTEQLTTEIQYSKTSNFGLCPFSSVLSEGVRTGVIIQAGAYYKLTEDVAELLQVPVTLGQGKDNVILTLTENQTLYTYLYQKILETYGLPYFES